MRRYVNSAGYALSGIAHALRTERNFPLFSAGVVASAILGIVMHITTIEWALVLLSGGMFLAVELLNTALERFTDAFKAHAKHHDDTENMLAKTTKDVSAGAALVSAIVWAIMLLIVFVPHIQTIFLP